MLVTFALTWRGTGNPHWENWWPALAPIAWYLQGRCNEIFLAFYLDAFDKLRINGQPSSTLAWPTRVRLALNSYVELILNFRCYIHSHDSIGGQSDCLSS
ncbi:hypothetical protein SAMN05428984_4175 [Sphingomonas sp. OK281]|nr:hypothetical protein SAMN05428984_4175 [Sphingomonas sp. OK281]